MREFLPFTIFILFLSCLLNRAQAQTNQTVINGTATTAVNFAGTGCTYNWTNDKPGIGLPASGTGNIQSFTAVNNGTTAVTATITATPIAVGIAYVPNSDDGTVSVVNAVTNAIISTITVGLFPFGVAASTDGSKVYITNQSSKSVSVINTTDNTVTATVMAGTYPSAAAVNHNGTRLYISNYGDNTISVINTLTNSVLSTVAVGLEPLGISVSPDDSFVYVANSYSNTVSVIQAATNTVSAIITVESHPFGVCFSPDGSRAYVTNHDAQSISVINTATKSVIASIKVGISPYGICSSPDGINVYVANLSDNTVSVINTELNSVTATIPVGALPYGICISQDGKNVYVVTRGTNSISTINTNTNNVSASTVVGSNPYSFGNFVTKGSDCNGTPITFTITVNSTSLPTITASTTTGNISACAGIASAGPNVEQFIVSGNNLTDDIIATAPTGFEVSLTTGNGYEGKVTLNQSGGTINNTVVYVRSAASAPVGNISGNVMLTSTGATNQIVAVTGIVNSLPTVNAVSNQIVNNGAATIPVNFTGTGNTFNWVNDTPGIGLAASGIGDIRSFTAVNNGNSPVIATITVTPMPAGFAYITNSASNTVSVINTAKNSVISTIPVGQDPQDISVNPNGTRVYVTNPMSNTVSVINTINNTVIATIPVSVGSFGMIVSPDGSRLYLINSNNIAVINTETYTIVSTIAVNSQLNGIAVSPDGIYLYVTNYNLNSVSVINTTTNAIVTTIPVGSYPACIALSPNGNRAYVANESDNTVSVINTQTNTVIASIHTAVSPLGVSVSPDGSKLYVTNFYYYGTVSVINTATNSVISTIDVGSAPAGISISPDGKQVYVANSNSATVSVINALTNTVISTISVGLNPFSIGNFVTGGTGCNGTPTTFTIKVNPTELAAAITSTGSRLPLNTIYGTASASTTFNISGSNLTAGILVTPPLGFEVSINGSTYSSTVTIGGVGNVAPTQVYIRLASVTPVGDYSGNIVLSSTGAGNVNVPMPGSTVNPAQLTITADNKSKTYLTVNPDLTVTYNGFVNNDSKLQLTTQPIITTNALTTSPLGQYPIIISGAASPDYSITYVSGVLTIEPDQNIVIPNTFTPNGDGINDTWNIKNLDVYSNCSIQIYNRYGENVYSSIGYGIPWDGKYKGADLPTGTYYYIINLKNKLKVLSGFVVIIR